MGESAELETVSEGRELDHRGAAADFARRVRERYGDVVETVLLYGSVARNEARGRDSDVDLLVVLVDDVDRTEFERRVRDLAYDVELEHGVVLSLVLTSESGYRSGGPFLEHVRRDAEPLYG